MEAQVLDTIAEFYLKSLNNDHKAIEYLQKSVPVWRAAGDRVSEGKALDKLGSLLLAQEEHAEALEHLSLALAIARAGNVGFPCLGRLSATHPDIRLFGRSALPCCLHAGTFCKCVCSVRATRAGEVTMRFLLARN
jgi:tetratricopeptide (TPR) repeat protein